MLKSLLFAFGLVVAAGPLQPSVGQHEGQKPYNRAQESDQANAPPTQSPTTINATPANNSHKKSTAPKSKQPEQWFDGWTVGDKIAALVGFIALLQFGALWVTWRVMANTAKRQLRAYVGVDALALELHKTLYKSESIFQNFLAVTAKNFGGTPAKEVRVIGYFSWTEGFPQRLGSDFDFYGFNDSDTSKATDIFASNFLLFPEQKEVSKVAVPDRKTLEVLHDGKECRRSVYVWGRIYYKDIYDRPWRTKFCHVWEPWHPAGERFVPYHEHNEEDQISWESLLPKVQ